MATNKQALKSLAKKVTGKTPESNTETGILSEFANSYESPDMGEYAKKSDLPDMSNYYTKSETQVALGVIKVKLQDGSLRASMKVKAIWDVLSTSRDIRFESLNFDKIYPLLGCDVTFGNEGVVTAYTIVLLTYNNSGPVILTATGTEDEYPVFS